MREGKAVERENGKLLILPNYINTKTRREEKL